MKKVRKAIVAVAGFGTRFLPVTKGIPKEMMPVVDKPVIHYIVEDLIESGIEQILFVTSGNKPELENYFDRSMELEHMLEDKGKTELLEQVRALGKLAEIHYIRQKELKGYGHAIYHGKTFVGNDPFVISSGDAIFDAKVPVTKQLMDAYDKFENPIVGCQTVAWEDVPKYGMVIGQKVEDRTYKVDDIIEKPAKDKIVSNLTALDRYIMTPELFDALEDAKPTLNGEVQLTDAIAKINKKRPVYAYDYEAKRYDCGDKLGYLNAIVDFALKRDEFKEKFRNHLKSVL